MTKPIVSISRLYQLPVLLTVLSIILILSSATPSNASENSDVKLRIKVLSHGDLSRKQVALTFDDGPHDAFTPQILDILAENNVKATFFFVGRRIIFHPNLVVRALQEGHCVGNHTFDHERLTDIDRKEIKEQIFECDWLIKSVTGIKSNVFRPPGGKYNSQVINIANDLGYTVVLWTANTGDYENPGVDVILNKVITRTGNGGIVLLHDGVPQTLEALPLIIESLKQRGFQFVTIDEYLNQN